MLRLEQISAGYGKTNCIFDISVEVREKEVVTLIGANGAGKSTILKVISGLLKPHSGALSFEDSPLAGCQPYDVVKKGISHVPEGRRVLTRLTVQENLELGAYLRSDKPAIQRDLDRVFSLFSVLGQRCKQLAGTLSGGEQQMLAIGRGLMARPKLLLLDEPSLGLAPKLVAALFQTIRRINQEGITVLLVEQNAYQALQIANRGYVVEAGKIVLYDNASQLIKDPKIKSAYLGG